MIGRLVPCSLSLVPFIVFSQLQASECLQYKMLPSLEIKVPEFSVSIVQPEKKMDLLHGNVISTLSEEYEMSYGAQRVDGGFCVFIEHISAAIGYTDFVVQIDKRHPFDSCEWHAIKEHEDEHIRAHLSVIDDGIEDMRRAIAGAANNMLPVFVENEDDIHNVMDDIEAELESQPQIKLMRQKLNAEQEIRNKKIDLNDKGWRIRACGA
ncbi:MAG: hypothetical protein LBT45_01435 [Rickettsiales bacterium]|nr:hypothetical protein [Rickettsiales bacterium]